MPFELVVLLRLTFQYLPIPHHLGLKFWHWANNNDPRGPSSAFIRSSPVTCVGYKSTFHVFPVEKKINARRVAYRNYMYDGDVRKTILRTRYNSLTIALQEVVFNRTRFDLRKYGGTSSCV
jgi:hypothetical protein